MINYTDLLIEDTTLLLLFVGFPLRSLLIDRDLRELIYRHEATDLRLKSGTLTAQVVTLGFATAHKDVFLGQGARFGADRCTFANVDC